MFDVAIIEMGGEDAAGTGSQPPAPGTFLTRKRAARGCAHQLYKSEMSWG